MEPKRKNGRPTKLEQIEIQNKLRPYFERYLSATFTSGKTGINIKTVCKYFDEWSKQVIETETKDFVQRQRETKEVIMLSMDSLIFENYELIDKIKNEIKNFQKNEKPIPKHLLSLHAQILYKISEIINAKGDLEVTPTLDISLEELIDKRISEVSQRNKAAAA